ncbi:MAG: hypothetical protein EOP04_24820 [Proteobacteria bacterium]|nr:MAG: hypothetical protein EOP04_24820 [Pseudomonadota bacterium]
MLTLSKLIERLQQSEMIKFDASLAEPLSQINKLSENDKERAYLLGCYFKNQVDPSRLSDYDKSSLIQTIREFGLQNFYYLNEVPDFATLNSVSYICLFGGLLAIVGGVLQLSEGYWRTGYSSRYMVHTVSGGGFVVILGLILLVSGSLRLRSSFKRSKLIRKLSEN